ncbi:regulator of G-protein signaling 1 [Gopherus flavomarginatus]|uniref:regulator of G-protein signaling 1 n=1 Tax=Mauremys reevesii TaxID=260615 RepID=UPI00193FC982|nr:regulator of G-protein signaling 1 [Mauremys reevesii]XP_050817441.1 regulator of G-protein signaling 1 [Gopherus flavomarginatus]
MPGLFFSHNHPTELKEADCKLGEGKVHKRKQKAFGADLKSYLKSMVPHLESSNKSNTRNVMLSAEEVMQWSQSLEKLLASQSGQVAFREFLKSEFSEENIEFWLACEDYKKTKSDHLQDKAEKIYEEFVQIDAAKQINIDYHTRKATAKKAQDPTFTSFDEAQKTVYVLMERDSYPRFLKSEAYLNLLNKLQVNGVK